MIPEGTRERLIRQIPLLGEEGQERVCSVRVATVGFSGNGSWWAYGAAKIGVLHHILVDPKIIEAKHLNRMLGAGFQDLGQPKVEVGKSLLEKVDPHVQVEALRTRIQDPKAVERIRQGADVISCGVDNNEARAFIQRTFPEKMLIDLGSGVFVQDQQVRLSGCQVTPYVPGGPCLFCKGLDRGGGNDGGLSHLSFVSNSMVAGALGVQLLANLLTGRFSRKNHTVFFNGLTHRLSFLVEGGDDGALRPQPDCEICGKKKGG